MLLKLLANNNISTVECHGKEKWNIDITIVKTHVFQTEIVAKERFNPFHIIYKNTNASLESI